MTQSEGDNQLFTVQDAAKYLGVSRTKVSFLIRDGVLTTLENPLDKRQGLITKDQLDKLKAFPTAQKLKNN